MPRPEIRNDNYIEYMVKLSVSCVMFAGLRLGKETNFISGIGAEELFAGYNRHKKGFGHRREMERKNNKKSKRRKLGRAEEIS